MDVEMVFNELSALKPAENVHIAREWMKIFIETTIVATKNGVKSILRIEDNFREILLAKDYPFPKWLNDPVNKDQKRGFLRLTAQRPVYAGFEDTQVERDYLLSTYQYHGAQVYGLHFAALLKALAVSLPSDDQWNVSQIVLQRQPHSSQTGDRPETLLVRHISQPQHVNDNADWIQERLRVRNPWLKHNLPKEGQYPYRPPKTYYLFCSDDFPTRRTDGNEKGFLDDKDQVWLWDKQEQHWDVQYQPYGTGNYFRVWPDGRRVS